MNLSTPPSDQNDRVNVELVNDSVSAVRDVVVPQARETEITSVHHGYFRIRYLYRRSHDTQIADEPGQDFLAFRDDGRRLVFVICDGVSQSFMGDLAARFLGERLIEWLWRDLPYDIVDKSKVSESLELYLGNLKATANQFIEQETIPDDLPTLVQTALQKKREYGSETTFAFGCIESPNSANPRGRIILGWMGNTEVQIWHTSNADDRGSSPSLDWDDKYRWSTKRGLVGGQPRIFVSYPEDIYRVVAYSDGLSSLREKISKSSLDNEAWQDIMRLEDGAKSDDLSFIEVDLAPPWWMLNDAKLATPSIQSIELDGTSLQVTWGSITGAEHYLVKFHHPGAGAESFEERVEVPLWKTQFASLNNLPYITISAVDKDGHPGSAANVTVRALSAPPRVATLKSLSRRRQTIVLILAAFCLLIFSVLGFVLGYLGSFH